jgi:phosphohistidine phosphatase
MATPTELYLVRHAIAADRGSEWPDDNKRPLTERGINRFKDGVKGLRRLDVALDEIFTSPLLRAKQTAELLAAGLEGKPPIKVLDALAPGHTPSAVMTQLARVAKRRRIALVGHEPDLGETAARWLGARGQVAFRKGAVCAIEVDSATPAGPGTLQWLLPPRVLRHLAP